MRLRPYLCASLGFFLSGYTQLQFQPHLEIARGPRAALRGRAATVPANSSVRPSADERRSAREKLLRMPLYFEPNVGQTDASVKFMTRGSGYGLFLGATEIELSLRGAAPMESGRQAASSTPAAAKGAEAETDGVAYHAIGMKLVGANPAARVTGEEELQGKTNYFIGNDPSKWRTNVPTYAKVKYEGVYPGVDLVYYGDQQQLEYDFVVAPGADPRAIRLKLQGAEQRRGEN